MYQCGRYKCDIKLKYPDSKNYFLDHIFGTFFKSGMFVSRSQQLYFSEGITTIVMINNNGRLSKNSNQGISFTLYNLFHNIRAMTLVVA